MAKSKKKAGKGPRCVNTTVKEACVHIARLQNEVAAKKEETAVLIKELNCLVDEAVRISEERARIRLTIDKNEADINDLNMTINRWQARIMENVLGSEKEPKR